MPEELFSIYLGGSTYKEETAGPLPDETESRQKTWTIFLYEKVNIGYVRIPKNKEVIGVQMEMISLPLCRY